MATATNLTALSPTALERINATIDRSDWARPSSWQPEVMSFDLEALRSIQRDLASDQGPLYVLYVQRPDR